MKQKNNEYLLERAETLALQALAFLAGDPQRLAHFMSETGVSAEQLRAGAGSPEIMEAALDALLSDESQLLSFAANQGISAEDIAKARNALMTAAGRKPPQRSA